MTSSTDTPDWNVTNGPKLFPVMFNRVSLLAGLNTAGFTVEMSGLR